MAASCSSNDYVILVGRFIRGVLGTLYMQKPYESDRQFVHTGKEIAHFTRLEREALHIACFRMRKAVMYGGACSIVIKTVATS